MKDPRIQAVSLARVYSKLADLSPPLGYPGGMCQVIDRAHENVDNVGVLDHLVDKLEEGEDLSNPEAGKIYKTPELERGPSSHPKFISSIRITSHAQYRMDQRGVTVNEIRLFLSQFAKAFHDGKSANSRDFRAWSEAISWGETINWTSKSLSGLTVAFTIKSGVANIVTAYWSGLNNPYPVSEEECGYPSAGRVARLYLASLEKRSSSTIPSPGYKTFVSPKSEMNLPSDIDTERQQVLPLPGSATPGGAGRDIPKFEYNTPGVEPRINPRTLGVPGEEYGVPYKEDYNMPTRRTMTGGDIIMYDQDNPANNEVKQPGPNVSYRAEGPFTYVRTPDEQAGVPAGHLTLTRDYTNTPPGSSRVIPDSMKEDVLNFSGGNSRNAALISEVMAKCGPDIATNSSNVKYKRLRINPKDAIITYSVDGSKGETYKVWVKGLRKGNVKTLSKMQIQVACTCNFFRWSGPEHWAKSNSFLYGKPAGTASKPEIRDPKGQNWLCKHVYAILRDHQGVKFASVSGPIRQDTRSLLESGMFPDSLVKTAKVLLNGGGSLVTPPSPKENTVMPRTLTAADRSTLIKLASSLPEGSPERKAILAGMKAAGKNGYIAFYKGEKMEVMADTSLEARDIAAKKFKAKKPYDVTVVLAEKDGKQVTHTLTASDCKSAFIRLASSLPKGSPERKAILAYLVKTS